MKNVPWEVATKQRLPSTRQKNTHTNSGTIFT